MTTAATYRQVLRRPHFGRYFTGEAISSVGDSMSEITIVILALGLATGDARPMAVAAASAAYLVPGILTGVLAGRHLGAVSARTLLLIDNAWRGAWLGLVAVLATDGALGLSAYVALLGLASLTRPLGAAGSRALVADLVADDDLFAANSLVNSTVQAAVMLGPAVAGVLAAIVGPGPVLAIDAVSFLLFAAVLLAVPASASRPRRVEEPGGATASSPGTLAVGWRWRWAGWLAGYRTVVGLFALTAVFHALYGPFVVGLPLLVEQRAGGLPTAAALGLLWSAFGVGAVLGGLAAGGRVSLASPRAAALIAAGWGAATIIVAVPAPLALAGGAMFAGGVIYAPYLAIVNTVMQRQLPPHRLPEAGAYYSSVTGIAGPVGTLVAGGIVAGVGPTTSLLGAGGVLVAAGLLAAAGFGSEAEVAPSPPDGIRA